MVISIANKKQIKAFIVPKFHKIRLYMEMRSTTLKKPWQEW